MPATHNITVPEEYEGRDGKKTKWNNIGVVITSEKDGKKSTRIKINMIPVNWDGWANVYPIDKDRDAKYAAGRKDNRRDVDADDQASAADDLQRHPAEDTVIDDIDDKPIDLSEIPF